MHNQNTIRVGVIGAGRIGKIHAEDLAGRIPGAQVVWIADPDLAAAKDTADRLRIANFSPDYRDILSDKQVDAVAICSPTALHAEHIIQAAEAGKHIFCEKPISYDLAKIDAANRAVQNAGVKLQIGFNRRFDVNFSRVQTLIRDGKIGLPHLLRITSRDPHPPSPQFIKSSGGMFFDMTIHDFDMAQFLFGDVEEVFAAGAVLVDPAIGEQGDIDTAVITLRFKNGAIGTIDNSRQAVYGYDQRIEAFGSLGMLQAQNVNENSVIYSGADEVASAKPLLFFLERYRDSFIREMAEFIACVQNDTRLPVTGEDARKPVVIGLAALRSLKENRPVKITEIDA